MEAHIDNNTIKLSVTNIQELKDLLMLAKKQANELQDTIHQLETFDINVEFATT